jgi:hypothetical protein
MSSVDCASSPATLGKYQRQRLKLRRALIEWRVDSVAEPMGQERATRTELPSVM